MESDKVEESVLKYLDIGVILMLALLYSGYTISLLWNGIISPTFNIKEVGVIQAVGISLIISFCRHSIFYPIKLEKITADLRNLFKVYFMTTTIYLVIGCIVLWLV